MRLLLSLLIATAGVSWVTFDDPPKKHKIFGRVVEGPPDPGGPKGVEGVQVLCLNTDGREQVSKPTDKTGHFAVELAESVTPFRVWVKDRSEQYWPYAPERDVDLVNNDQDPLDLKTIEIYRRVGARLPSDVVRRMRARLDSLPTQDPAWRLENTNILRDLGTAYPTEVASAKCGPVRAAALPGGDGTVHFASATSSSVAAVTVPGLLRARISANEAASIGNTRTLISAESAFFGTFSRYGTLRELARPPYVGLTGPAFIDQAWADGGLDGTGYLADIQPQARAADLDLSRLLFRRVAYQLGSQDDFDLWTCPAIEKITGSKFFYADASGVVRQLEGRFEDSSQAKKAPVAASGRRASLR